MQYLERILKCVTLLVYMMQINILQVTVKFMKNKTKNMGGNGFTWKWYTTYFQGIFLYKIGLPILGTGVTY